MHYNNVIALCSDAYKIFESASVGCTSLAKGVTSSRIIGMLIIIFHMKMKGKIAYSGCSYVEKMHTLPYFCDNNANTQAGYIPGYGDICYGNVITLCYITIT